MNYNLEVDLPEGRLVVSPLRPEWLQRSADLLTDSFVDTKGIQPYRRYVRRNITTYLEQHIKMPPSAVLLAAILHRQLPAGPGVDLMLDDLDALTGSSSGSSSSSSSNGSGGSGSNLGGSSSSSSPESANGNGSGNGISAGLMSSSASSSTTQPQQQPLPRGSGADTSSSSSSSAAASDVGSIMRSALQQLSQGLGLQQQQQPELRAVQTLLGITEVSFREATRSRSLTLNPPAKGAYLCNMAVSRQWQRRGVASRLITAVDDLCLLAGEREVFLHLRFKDEATAGQLYSGAGFTAFKADWPILVLLGQDPRYLMRKQLQPDKQQLAGCVKLPAAAAGQVAAQQEEAAVGVQQAAAAATPAAAASPAA